MTYQTVTPTKLAVTGLSTVIATIYTVPAGTRTILKNVDICNTTAGVIDIEIHLVPSGGSAATDNALIYGAPVQANSIVQWEGVQVLNPGDTIQARGASPGLTVHASGGEAR